VGNEGLETQTYTDQPRLTWTIWTSMDVMDPPTPYGLRRGRPGFTKNKMVGVGFNHGEQGEYGEGPLPR